jgi:pimeloyl-ACP methyl ester carboxylesterase
MLLPFRIRLLTFLAVVIVSHAEAQETRSLNVDGHRLRVRVAGLEHFGARPVVVFESGARMRLETWDPVFARVAAFAPVLAYDRGGNGESDADPHSPTPEHVARTLHALLAEARLKPPYVLVGQSWGGPLIRMYAGIYPDEVAGLVYVDPSDWRTEAEDIEYFRAQGYSPEGRLKRRAELFASAPAGGEYGAIREAASTFFAALRILPRMPDVPVTVLMSARDVPSIWKESPCAPAVCQQNWLRFRTQWLGAVAREVSNGTLIVSSGSGHEMHRDDPPLVIAAVERVVRAARRTQ